MHFENQSKFYSFVFEISRSYFYFIYDLLSMLVEILRIVNRNLWLVESMYKSINTKSEKIQHNNSLICFAEPLVKAKSMISSCVY